MPMQREWAFQETVAEYLDLALPVGAYWTSIDQGRAENARIGAARRKRGIKAGVPDVLIVWRGTTLWFELKAGSRVSKRQKDVHKTLLENGHFVTVPICLQHIYATCKALGMPMRARPA